MVAMLPLSLRCNAGSFEPSQMLTLSCRRNSSKSVTRKVSHLLEISHTYYTIESGVGAMCAGKAIHALHQGHQPQKNKALHSASTAPIHALLAVTTALCIMLSARALLKKVTGMQSAASLVLPANKPLSLMELRRPPIVDTVERGRKLTWYKLTLRKHPHMMSCSLMWWIVEL